MKLSDSIKVDAPVDGGQYGRKGGKWEQILTDVINTPVITSPQTDDENITLITSSGYNPSSTFTGTHDSSDWELSKDSTFSTIDISSYDDIVNLVTFPVQGFDVNTVYYCRVRYTSGSNKSSWSPVVSFMPAHIYIGAPSVTSSNTQLDYTFTGSEFTVNGGTDTYVSTNIQISTESDFSTINTDETFSGLSYDITLVKGTTYYIRMKYTGENYVSEFGTVQVSSKSVTTEPDITVPSSSNEMSTANITINNYDSDCLYTITVSAGTATQNGSNISWELPDVGSTVTESIQVTAENTAYGFSSSSVIENMEIVDIPMVEDQSLIYNSSNMTEFSKLAGTEVNSVVHASDYMDVIDTENTSSTSKVYIDNSLVDIQVGDRIESDGELFNVSVVNNDGTVAGIDDVKIIACGSGHTVVIKDNGEVHSIGYNHYGQLGDGTTTNRSSFVYSGISGKSVACGSGHTVVIKDNGEVHSIGRNDYGQLGDGTTTNRSSFVYSGISGKSVACGYYYTVVIKDNNEVHSVGYNNYGQLGDGTTTNRSSFVYSGISGKSVACGEYYTVVIKDNGEVWSVGQNGQGQLGDGTTTDRSSFVYSGISGKSVACGDYHTVVIKDNGEVWAIGNNYYGQLGDGTNTHRHSFVNTGISGKSVACGSSHTVVIKDNNEVWSVGYNYYGQLGDGTTTKRYLFVYSGISGKSVACGKSYTIVIKDNGEVWSVGYNGNGQLGDGTTTDRHSFVYSNITAKIPEDLVYLNYWVIPETNLSQVPTNAILKEHKAISNAIIQDENDNDFTKLSDIVIKENALDILDANNSSSTSKIYINNSLVEIQPGDTLSTDNELFTVSVVNNDGTVAIIDGIKTVACGSGHTVVIKDNGEVHSIGYNNYGQLGDGTNTNRSSFVNTGIFGKSVACGTYNTFVIKDNNEVYSVGYNNYGQLGDGTTTDRRSFVYSGISGKSVACSEHHTSVIKDNNEVHSVGYNSKGQLGDGTTTDRSSFVYSGISGKSVACGGYHTVVIKDNNEVHSVGYNNHGQLGDGTTTNRRSFVNTGISGKSVACGYFHTSVIKDNNEVHSVGNNDYGQLGDGTTKERRSFVYSGISGKSVACGVFHTSVIKDNNEVHSVGQNGNGQLGDGTTTDRSSFVYSGISGKSVACGGYHTVVIKDNNEVHSVGYNNHGQLGDGTTTDRSSFVNSNITSYVPEGSGYINYWVVPETNLSQVPTSVYGISDFFINDTKATIDSVSLINNTLEYTVQDIDFTDTSKLVTSVNLQEPNELVQFTGTLHKLP